MNGIGNMFDPAVSLAVASGNFKPSTMSGDICIRILTNDLLTGIPREERLFAHRLLLAASSPFLRGLVEACAPAASGLLPVIPTIEVNLGTLPNAARAFKIIINFLYSGELELESVDPLQVLHVSRLCQVVTAELRLTSISTHNLLRIEEEKANSNSQPALLPQAMHTALPASVELKWLIAMQMLNFQQASHSLAMGQPVMPPQHTGCSSVLTSPSSSSSLNLFLDPKTSEQCDSPDVPVTSRAGVPETIVSQPRSSTSKDKSGEVIVPSNDKEGWCRNKKYIERVSNGFMCTVCWKIYGRYNSVSYHVTIYDRNPPIKCDENGCQFTTREARYIHFHKYYRHHIPLPQSIDLGCRKCPFCRHVSKSPAMLEKHISRHIPDCSRDGRHFKCPKCPVTAESQREIFEHVLQHQTSTALQCDQCNYRGRTTTNLEQHKLFKHSKEMFKEKLECVEWNFKCVSGDGLPYHYERLHRVNAASEDELQENSSHSFASTASTSAANKLMNQNPDDCAGASGLCIRPSKSEIPDIPEPEPEKMDPEIRQDDPLEEQDEPMCLVMRNNGDTAP